MPIDVAKVVGAEMPDAVGGWDADDVILYHLGLGAGTPPTEERELEYVYEARLKVLPSFSVIPAFGALGGMIAVDGIDINPMMILHGEQRTVLHKPLPTSAKVTSSGRITDVFDKGKGAAVVIEADTRDEVGELLATNRFLAFVRGEGGFGGEPGPAPGNPTPDREPDLVVESPTLPQQAALYRLSGDKNPLHIDPALASMVGFERPILHGLCSYGIVCKAVVDHALGGDVTAVADYEARFAGVLFPGETIVTSMWNENDKVIINATCKERGTPVITNAAITRKEG
jgi:acyl dehydratase